MELSTTPQSVELVWGQKFGTHDTPNTTQEQYRCNNSFQFTRHGL